MHYETIITMPSKHLSPYIVKTFLVIRNFKIYFLSKFKICNIVLLIIITICISYPNDIFIL